MTADAQNAYENALRLEASGDQDGALASFMKALELCPEDNKIAFKTATALLRTGQLDEALSQFRRIVFAEPDHLPARANLGNCHFLLGDFHNAEVNFSHVLNTDAENVNALFGLASIRLAQGKAEEALPLAKQLTARLPEDASAHALLAEALEKSGNAPTAIGMYRKAVRSDPNHVPALTGTARVLMGARRFNEAMVFAETAHKLAAGDFEPLKLLGDANRIAGKFGEARKAYEDALVIKPENSDVKLSLCAVLRRLGEPLEALDLAIQVFDCCDDRTGAANAIGACLSALRQPEAARKVLTRSMASEPLPTDVRATLDALVAPLRPSGKDAHPQPESPPVDTPSPENAEEEVPSPEPSKEISAQPQPALTDKGIVNSGTCEQSSPTIGPPAPAKTTLSLVDQPDVLPNVLGLRRQDSTRNAAE